MSAKKSRATGKKPRVAKGAKAGRKKVSKQPKVSKAEKPAKVEAVPEEKKTIPAGPIPVPVVNARHEGSAIQRRARGYSRAEMTTAGINPISAGRWNVPVDIRRKTLLPENAEKLKGWLKGTRATESGRKVRTRKKE